MKYYTQENFKSNSDYDSGDNSSPSVFDNNLLSENELENNSLSFNEYIKYLSNLLEIEYINNSNNNKYSVFLSKNNNNILRYKEILELNTKNSSNRKNKETFLTSITPNNFILGFINLTIFSICFYNGIYCIMSNPGIVPPNFNLEESLKQSKYVSTRL